MAGILAALLGGGAARFPVVIGKGTYGFLGSNTTGYQRNPIPTGTVSPPDASGINYVAGAPLNGIYYNNTANRTTVSLFGHTATNLFTFLTTNGTDRALSTGVNVTSASATVTMTIASPCVVSWASHGTFAGTPVMFTTTGALPTGVLPNVVYFVRNTTTNTFELGLTPASASSINTSGTQSGVHTGLNTPITTFDCSTLGDFIGQITGSAGPYAVTMTIANPCVVTWTAHGQANGQRVILRTTGALPSGLSVDTVYYVVNAATNTFQLAATAGGAAIATSGTQSGSHTIFQAVETVLR
jgi:hypothetical protein